MLWYGQVQVATTLGDLGRDQGREEKNEQKCRGTHVGLDFLWMKIGIQD